MPDGLLAPRLYRAAFVPALLALIVLAFSLQQPTTSVAPELSPPGFSAQRAQTFADQAVTHYGAREAGSKADADLAELVAARLADSGFRTSSTSFSATTLSGRRELVNVVGVRPGPSDRRLLVLVSRDGAPGELHRSGALETGSLVELARVLQGRTFEHTLVLASVSGGVDGGIGARRLLRDLHGPLDAVIVLRNISSPVVDSPVLAAGDSRQVPDESYLRTVRRIAALEFGRTGKDQRRSFPAQLVRLGFPVALGEQSSAAAEGINAVSVSPGGEPLKVGGKDATRVAAQSGQIVLRALTTFDTAAAKPPPATAPLRVGGKLIPQWALIVLIATLLLPLVVASIDAWARARRRQQSDQRGLLAPAIAFVWLLVIGLLLRSAGLSGLIDAPPLAPDPAALSGFGASGVGLLAVLLGVLGVLTAAGSARQATPKGGEAAFALWIVFAVLAVLVVNPVAAGFLLLPAHLVILMLLTAVRPRRRQVFALTLVGLLPLLLAALYFPVVFTIAPRWIFAWGVLLVSGGFVSIAAVVAAAAVAAAFGTALTHLWWGAPRPQRSSSRAGAAHRF